MSRFCLPTTHFGLMAAILLGSTKTLAAPPGKPGETPVSPELDKPALENADQAYTPDAESAEEKAARREKAKEHFQKGETLFRKSKDYPAALAEFFESRRLYPTRSATSSAAACLQLLHRYDESLDMYEVLFLDYDKDLPKNMRATAQQGLLQMRGLVGSIDIADAEIDAGLRIDGRNRGNFPLPAPMRVAAGSHTVRVYKEGYEPFETNIDIAGNQIQTVHARLRKLDLDQAGVLRVSETKGRVLDVVIDGSVVGKTPWEGHLRDGEHNVVLEGEDDWGTPPAIVHVKKGGTEMLGLSAEKLEANIKIVPTPAGATVAIDGVSVGRGVWQGRVHTGKHRIEIAADGYVIDVKDVSFANGVNDPIALKLDRDPLSPLWKDNRGRVFVEASLGPGLVPTFGGDLVGSCGEGCSQGVGFGTSAKAHGGYRFPSGFFVGLDVGDVYVWQKVSDRATTLQPPGFQPQQGMVSDTLSLRGVLVGASAGIRIGKALPFSFRLGAGALVGAQFRDHRVGSFETVKEVLNNKKFPAESYAVDLTQVQSMTALYIAPNVQMAVPLKERLHLQVGLDALVIVSPGLAPMWKRDAAAPRVKTGKTGLAVFPAQALMNGVMVLVAPEVSIRYEF
jgi:PEGA domain